MLRPTFVASLLVTLVVGCSASVGDPNAVDDPTHTAAPAPSDDAGTDGAAQADGGATQGDAGQSDAGESASKTEATAAKPIAIDSLVVTPTDWVGTVPGLGKKKLSEIYLPGTHDSGTYGLISTYSRPLDDAFAPDADPIVKAGSFVGSVEPWAKAQERTITQQLEDGMRVLDLRPCREKSGAIRICHQLYGPLMLDILNQVHNFATLHPKELIILSLGGFSGLHDEDHVALGQLMKGVLANNLIDAQKGITPSSTLNDVWTKQPDRSVLVLYVDGHAPSYALTTSDRDKSWVDTWDRTKKKDSLVNAMANADAENLFDFSGPATPNDDLILRSTDPLGNYPKNLKELAAQTNPVMLGWIRDEWAQKRLNMVSVDFENKTCLYPLMLKLNGLKDVSLDGCDIGDASSSWGNWKLLPYGRGAGHVLVCPPGKENVAGLCYTTCQSGYSMVAGMPYLCGTNCPSDYTDVGATCHRAWSEVAADNSKCPAVDLCGLTFYKGCTKCPSGYSNDGCLCRRDASTIAKSTYSRGVGTIPSSCGAGEEKDGALCYPQCRPGYDGVGPMCWPKK
jgi:hypothetical protein